MSGARGVPEQEKPENQDEDVRFRVDEMTGAQVKLDEKGEEASEPEAAEQPTDLLVEEDGTQERRPRKSSPRGRKEEESGDGSASGERL